MLLYFAYFANDIQWFGVSYNLGNTVLDTQNFSFFCKSMLGHSMDFTANAFVSLKSDILIAIN